MDTSIPARSEDDRRTARRRPCRHLLLEPLESRQMLAADLTGTAFDVTGGQPLPGGAVSATFTVKNQNGFWFLDDAGPFQVKVFLSPDNSIGDASDTLVGSTSFTGLGAGQSVSRSIPLALPLTDPYLNDNDYRIGMVIDPANQVAESDESNNANLGDGRDGERVWFEGNVYSPVNRYAPWGSSFAPGASLSGAIGGSDERMGGLDIDSFWFQSTAGQTVAFDLDGGGWTSDLRLYLSNGALIAQNSGGAAPGEPAGTGESLIRYTFPYQSYFYITVSASGNHTSDPCLLTGRTASSQGSYVINTVVLPNAPATPDLDSSCDSGISSADNITNASLLKFSFNGQPGKIAQLFVDGVLRGTDPNGTAGGLYEITASGLGDGAHTITANLLDPANGYASDLSAPLTIRTDTTRPTAPAPDLAAAADSGLSNTDNITNDATPTFEGLTEPDSLVQLYQNSSPAASGDSGSTGAWSLTPTLGLDGTYAMTIRVTDLAGNTSVLSPALSFTLDTAGPSFTAPMTFQYDTAPQRITMAFSDDVAATLSSADLTVLDLATSGTVGVTLAYDRTARAATFTLSGAGPGAVPPGEYRAALLAAGVTDLAGNGVAGNALLNFHFLPGDANHDRKVDVVDLGILATNWQKRGMTFSQGDFNYDGNVDVVDLGILATNWQASLPEPQQVLSSSSKLRNACSAAPTGMAGTRP